MRVSQVCWDFVSRIASYLSVSSLDIYRDPDAETEVECRDVIW